MFGKSRIVSIVDRSKNSRSRLKQIEAILKQDGSPDLFLSELLASQCRFAGASAGGMLRQGEQDQFEIVATYPPFNSVSGCPQWIDTVIKSCPKLISSADTIVLSDTQSIADGGQSRRHIIAIPIREEDAVRAVAAFLVQVKTDAALAACRERLEITPFLLNHFEQRLTLKKKHQSHRHLRRVLEILAVVNEPDRLLSAAMALCNEIDSRMNCRRVSLGFLSGRHVRVRAISHTDTFRREMQLVQDIETAMEECLDQDLELIYPADEEASYVSRATETLSRTHGPGTVLSLPIRRNGEVFAVLTLERESEEVFDVLEEIEPLRLLCDLCAPRLFEKHAQDRWLGARAAISIQHKLAGLLGPEHTWIKGAAITVIILALFLIFAKGDHRIEASFKFEAPVQQVVVAPFDSYIRTVSVEPGDEVKADENMLGVLDTSELRLNLAALKAERLGYQKKAAASMRDGNTAEAQIASAQSDKIAAEIDLLEKKVKKAKLIAPISGRVVSQDLKRQIGAPVETGEVLFEIAHVDSLRAELYVPEMSIARIDIGQEGELAAVGHPDQRIRFVVERINPMAEVVNGKNVFNVRARLQEQREWMRPGMEGVAKISAGKKPYIWLGTYRVINWLRMKLWI